MSIFTKTQKIILKKKSMLFTFTEYKFICCSEEPRDPIGWNCHMVPLWGYISWASRPTTAEQTLWSSVQLQTMQGLLEEGRAATVESDRMVPEDEMVSGVSEACYEPGAKMNPQISKAPRFSQRSRAYLYQTADNAGCAAPANYFSALPQLSTVVLAQIVSCYISFPIAM